jgi:LacI family transcriptional regulator
MADVARRAGVSISTVSHVLNGTRKVSPETARAVEDAIRDVGYIQNTLARALARSATNSVGVAISAISNHYFSEIVRAIEAECARHGLMIFLSDTRDDPEHELKVVHALHQRRVDGLILAPAADPEQRVLRYLERNQVPAVLIDRLASPRFDQVGVENSRATTELVLHLAAHGHRRIALISGLEGLTTTQERIAGYRAGLEAAGLPWDGALVRSGGSLVEPAQAALALLLREAAPPTAIVSGNNLMTIGAMRALREAGLDVPRDIALVAFDDFDWADSFSPRLTVMAQPCEELGTRAVRLLMRRIEQPDAPRQTLRLSPTLHVRNSCGC